MTLRVSVLTEDPSGPSARHRWVYPTPSFGEHGVEISIHDISRPVRREAFAAATFDTVRRRPGKPDDSQWIQPAPSTLMSFMFASLLMNMWRMRGSYGVWACAPRSYQPCVALTILKNHPKMHASRRCFRTQRTSQPQTNKKRPPRTWSSAPKPTPTPKRLE